MNLVTGARLSAMMFLQFFIWGAWYVTCARYLQTIGFAAGDIGWTYSVGPIAGMISPFFVGMIADKFFPAKWVLAAFHFAGAAIMYGASVLMQSGGVSPNLINGLFFIYMLTYFPTLALTNTLALQTMTNPEKEFPWVRVFGTIGWIAAGYTLTHFKWGSSVEMFYLASGCAAALGVYSMTLPHTAPPLKGEKTTVGQVLGLDALVLFKKPSFAIFMLSSLLICIPLAFYYQIAERSLSQSLVAEVPVETLIDPDTPLPESVAERIAYAPTYMSWGQTSEIIFMLLMPFFFIRLGVKWMLVVGMGAWVARYALFASGAPAGVYWMMILGIVLHGICYDFFFVTGQIYTDRVAPAAIRGQAQGLLVLCTLGLGMFIGAQTAGRVEGHYTTAESLKYTEMAEGVGKQIADLKLAETPDEDQISKLTKHKQRLTYAALRSINWKMLWGIPAIGAGVILLLFAVLFRDDPEPDMPVTSD